MNATALYRAVWRWHFYAGLLTFPVLTVLAVNGALYLFKEEVHQVVYRDMIEIAAREATPASASLIRQSAESALHGELIQLILPARSDRTAQALVRTGSGDVRTAYLDPYDGRFLGSTAYGGVMQTVRNIHSLMIVGTWANILVEIVAGWAIVMVLTGIFLWWPRGSAGILKVRGGPHQRMFWRDTHAIVGVFAGAVILFLAVTGMPWSPVWGANVQTWATANGLGAPAAPAAVTPHFLLGASHDSHDAVPQQPWAMEGATPPHSHHHDAGPAMDLDAAVAHFEALGIQRPFGVQPPKGSDGAYAATYLSHRVQDTRRVYLDQYSGAVLDDVTFSDYGAVAKAIEWGIAAHQGQQYGEINRFVMLLGCLGLVALATSGIVMWWKRRPPGSLGAPARPGDRKAALAALAAIAVVGVIYPLTGLSFVAAMFIDAAYGLIARAGIAD